MNLLEQKKQLRAELKQRRSLLPENERQKNSSQIHLLLQKIDAFQQAKRIFCYISYLSEVDTRPLIQQFFSQNLALAVPKIMDKTTMIAVPVDNLEEMAPDSMGIFTPKSSEIAGDAFDIAITPGLGFTELGARLGYGRGYYDRWFSNNKVNTKIGIAFEAQLVDELPTEKTDVLLDILVTEDRIIDLRK